MKTYVTLDPYNYIRLNLMVPAIALLGLTSCSTGNLNPKWIRRASGLQSRALFKHLLPDGQTPAKRTRTADYSNESTSN